MVRQKRRKSSTFSQLKRPRILSSSFLSASLDIIGIRPVQPDAPLHPNQKAAVRNDLIISFVILFVTLLTRFYRLAVPPKIGKLNLVAIAKLFGYKAIDFSFSSIGKGFGDLVYYPQRAFAAACGSLIPPVMYLTGRSLSLSVIASICTAAMPLFDFLLCIESRLILTDSQLILYLQAAYLFAFLLWQTPRSTPRRFIFLIATAVSAACALSTKWTAFVAPLIIAFISLTGAIFPYARLDIIEMGVAAIIAAIIYIGSFFIHFKLLPLSGDGDAFMRNEFQATLIGNSQYDANATRPSFIENFWYLNWEMLRANSAIETRHPWESKWYEWLYNARGVLYVDENAGNGLKERVYIVINPVLSVITIIGVFISIVYVLIKFVQWVRLQLEKFKNKRNKIQNEFSISSTNSSTSSKTSGSRGKISSKRNQNRRNSLNDGEKEEKLERLQVQVNAQNNQRVGILALSFVAWCMNLFPYIGITRCTFIYHVLPSLQISSLMTGVLLNYLPTKYKIRSVSCTLIIIAMAAAYYRWSPWIYALPRTEKQLHALRLLPRWD